MVRFIKIWILPASTYPQIYADRHRPAAVLPGEGMGQRTRRKKTVYILPFCFRNAGFYKAMGCREAAVYQQAHVETEPFDCQLKCIL